MEGYHFRNWARTYECHPDKFYEPEDVDQLRAVLQSARNEGGRIRVVGWGRSPSDLCCISDVMLSMRKYNRVINVDQQKMTVTAQAGVTLKQLVGELEVHNLALSVLPSIGDVTLAGVVSTCTHGSGVKYGVLADSLVSMSLMTVDGGLIECSRRHNSHIFHGVCGGLGALGIIVQLEFQCEPYYNLKHIRYPLSFDQFVQSLDELCGECDHFKANYFPYTDRVVVSSVSRSKLPPTKPPVSFSRRAIDAIHNFLLVYVLEFLYFLSVYFPFLVRYINRLAYLSLFSQFAFVVDGYERVSFFDCLFHQYVSEWTVPRSQCGPALRRLKTVVENENIPAHFPIEIRFIKRDWFWLSPAYDRDVCAINAVAYCPYDRRPEHGRYWSALAEIMKSMGGRPHLAKDHTMTVHDMTKAYPKLQQFLQLRRTMDPDNVLVNDYVQRIMLNS